MRSVAQAESYCRGLCLRSVMCLVLGLASGAAHAVPLPRERPRTTGDQSNMPALQWSSCDQRLTEVAQFKRLPPITGPGECIASDVILMDAIRLLNGEHAIVTPPATLRCSMAEAVAHWVRNGVAPAVATVGTRCAASRRPTPLVAEGAMVSAARNSASTVVRTRWTCSRSGLPMVLPLS
jgi:hypothetical protein